MFKSVFQSLNEKNKEKGRKNGIILLYVLLLCETSGPVFKLDKNYKID